jgi:hypothetical protein
VYNLINVFLYVFFKKNKKKTLETYPKAKAMEKCFSQIKKDEKFSKKMPGKEKRIYF